MDLIRIHLIFPAPMDQGIKERYTDAASEDRCDVLVSIYFVLHIDLFTASAACEFPQFFFDCIPVVLMLYDLPGPIVFFFYLLIEKVDTH